MLADDFFRLAHDDVTGRPRLRPKAVGIGCAAALLTELVNTRHITVADNRVTVVNKQPPADSLAHVVLDQLIAEAGREHNVRTWLAFLAGQAPEQVAHRLLRAGHVRMEAVRRLGRQTGVLYVPLDMNVAARPWALLSHSLRRHDPLDYESLCLAGLALATGLDAFLLDGAPAATFDYLRQAVGTLCPPMRELLFHTHAAIGDAVLAHRT
ncbi:GOLPH3/VPS74 family protein [Micromonospora thermarum]|uniref:GPP34 family phosphoprotein n=1 Tax=Micromonospora thermarum TaxID=2720024 RepID=A0ABX0ZFU4_9ACTN|nr:GPP34 family phosphoprotein [Micromonospora thermarum]NJP35819.1 GPP34 family phosphoprotein [Micromonospora thermarum]